MESSHSFPAYYTVLCARTADAIDAIDQQCYQEARELLVAGMQEAEEIHCFYRKYSSIIWKMA